MLSAIRPATAAVLIVTAMTASGCAPTPTGGQSYPEGASVPLSAKPSEVTAEPDTQPSRVGGNGRLTIVTSDDEFRRVVSEPGKPVLLYFSAPWCGPCRIIAPVLEGLVEDGALRMQVVSINTDRLSSIAMQHQVTSMPTMILIKEGRIVDRLTGTQPKRVVLEFLDRNLP